MPARARPNAAARGRPTIATKPFEESPANAGEEDFQISPGRRRLYQFFTLGLALLATLLVLEAAFRAAGRFSPPIYRRSAVPGLNFEMRPRAKFKIDDHLVQFNGQGHRDGDLPSRRPPESKLVACLGDSMTQALGLPVEQTYLNLLEKVEANGSPALDVEFYNMGVSGYNTMQEWISYERFAKSHSPDLVLVQYILNDVMWSYPVDMGDGFKTHAKAFLSAHFRTYQFLKYLKLRLFGGFNALQIDVESLDPNKAPVSPEYMRPYYDPNGEHFQEWREAAAKFGSLNRSGTKVFFAIFPWPIYKGMDRGEPYPYYEFHNQVKAALDEEGIPYVDFAPLLASKGNLRDFWVKPSDFHLNAEAHQIVAGALEPEITRLLRSP